MIIKRQTYSAVLHISSVSLFRGRGMPVLNKNQSTQNRLSVKSIVYGRTKFMQQKTLGCNWGLR